MRHHPCQLQLQQKHPRSIRRMRHLRHRREIRLICRRRDQRNGLRVDPQAAQLRSQVCNLQRGPPPFLPTGRRQNLVPNQLPCQLKSRRCGQFPHRRPSHLCFLRFHPRLHQPHPQFLIPPLFPRNFRLARHHPFPQRHIQPQHLRMRPLKNQRSRRRHFLRRTNPRLFRRLACRFQCPQHYQFLCLQVNPPLCRLVNRLQILPLLPVRVQRLSPLKLLLFRLPVLQRRVPLHILRKHLHHRLLMHPRRLRLFLHRWPRRMPRLLRPQ